MKDEAGLESRRACRSTRRLGALLKSRVGVLVLSCCASVANAGPDFLKPWNAGADFLEPCKVELPGYMSRVDALIDGAVVGERRLGFTMFPSFTPESGVRVVERDGGFVAAHVTFQASAGHSSRLRPLRGGRVAFKLTDADVFAIVREHPIDESLVRRIAERVTSETGMAQAYPYEGFRRDGVTYYFRAAESACAKTWSPEQGSRRAKLVAIFTGLASLAQASTDQSREHALAEVERLVGELASK